METSYLRRISLHSAYKIRMTSNISILYRDKSITSLTLKFLLRNLFRLEPWFSNP